MLFYIVLFLPFIGTALGASAVFFSKRAGKPALLDGFAGGVMTASAIFSLLIPSLENGVPYRGLVGLAVGFVFFFAVDVMCELLSKGKRSPSLAIAIVTLHNLPEGMAVGMALAGLLAFAEGLTAAGVFALSLGVAIQNLPEGAIVSLPLASRGRGRLSAFGIGVLSGAVEPIGAAMALLLSGVTASLLPYALSFAAGAMLAVVVGELSESFSCRIGRYAFAVGFVLMTVLDVLLG